MRALEYFRCIRMYIERMYVCMYIWIGGRDHNVDDAAGMLLNLKYTYDSHLFYIIFGFILLL